jgi:hypothetical protein
MSNKQNNQNRALLDQERNRANTQYQNFNTGQQQAATQFGNNAAGTRQSTIDRYSNNNNFLPPGMAPNSNGFFDTSGAATSAGGDFSGAKAGYDEASKTGLINRGDFTPALEGYKGFMANGGVNADALRHRATAQIPDFYNAYKSNLARRQNVQGGYSPGFDAQTEEIGRQAGREGFNASRQVEGDIADKTQQGMEFGVSGYGNLASNIAGMEQSGRLAGMGGLTQIGGLEAENNRFNAGEKNTLQRQLLDAYQRGGITNAQGMSDVMHSDIGQYQNANSNQLAGMGGQANTNLGNIGQRQQIQDRHWYDMIPGLVGAAGGIAGGLGSMGYKPFSRPQ